MPATPPRLGYGGFLARTLTIVAAVPLGVLLTLVLLGIIGGVVALVVADVPLEPVGDPAPGAAEVREIPIDGIIADGELARQGGFLDAERVSDELTRAVDEDAVAVVLPLTSPGGTASASFVIADAITETRDAGVPVVVHGRGEVASGAAIIAAHADETILDPSTIFGSYGVMIGPFRRYDEPIAVDDGALVGGVETEEGVREESLTAGRGKDALSPFVDDPDEETMALLQDAADREYGRILDRVTEYREVAEGLLVDEFGAGLFDSEVAVEEGLADELASRAQARERAAELADEEVFQVMRVPPDALRELTLLGGILGDGPLARVLGAGSQEGCLSEPAVLTYRGDPANLRCD